MRTCMYFYASNYISTQAQSGLRFVVSGAIRRTRAHKGPGGPQGPGP